jgi:hypothetical protein
MAGATHTLPGERLGAKGPLDSLRRALAVALLPLSILPVVLFGPALLRAPQKLWREAQAEVQRLQAAPRSPAVKQAARQAAVAGKRGAK